MSLFTSSQFASSAASGTDWRDTAKNVLEKLESIRTEGHKFNFGFLYISDHLVDDVPSILNLFKSVLGIESWVGSVGIGICGTGESFVDVPAIAAMIGYFDPETFLVFSAGSAEESQNIPSSLEDWLKHKTAMLTLVHGHPFIAHDFSRNLKNLESWIGGFLVGGLISSRTQHVHFTNTILENVFCGVVFTAEVPVATTLSQGCTPISPVYTITKAEDNVIFEIDNKKAMTVFEEAIRSTVLKKTDLDSDQIILDKQTIENKTAMSLEIKKLFDAQIHAGFTISGTDQNDYLVRNITHIDPDRQSLSVAQGVTVGERFLFVERDHETLYKDLSIQLVNLRRRLEKERGIFAPKGAVYISCVARAFNQFEEKRNTELELIRDILGDIPLVGFYAGGEICKGRLYGYTGILTLFL